MKIKIDGQTYDVEARPGEVVVDGKPVATKASRRGAESTVEVGGRIRKVELKGETVVVDGKAYAVVVEAPTRPAPQQAAAPSTGAAAPAAAKATESTSGTVMRAPMPGKILRVVAKEGAKVAIGDILLVLEAMKMENEIRATAGGIVKSLPVAAGSTVAAGDVLAVIE